MLKYHGFFSFIAVFLKDFTLAVIYHVVLGVLFFSITFFISYEFYENFLREKNRKHYLGVTS